MGLGLHGGGAGTAKFMAKAGARVLVTDLKKAIELGESIEKLKGFKIKLILGQHRTEDFINTDLVIQNPAVPDNSKYLEIAKKHRVPVDTDMGIFFELCANKKIGVTGTKGKSTTAKLIFDILKTKHKNVVLAGNIRSAVLLKLKKIEPKNPVVLELSSWQLHGLQKHKKSPETAVVTNILNDHQNRYRAFDHYIDDKKTIIRFQKKNGLAVLNYDDHQVRDFGEYARGQILYFSVKNDLNKLELEKETVGAFIKNDQLVFGPDEEKIIAVKEIPLLGRHNQSNTAAAVSVAKAFAVPIKDIARAIKKFSAPTGRLEKIAWNKDRLAFNDTTATTPDATLASLTALKEKYPQKPITLILGGTDKKLDFTQLAATIKEFHQGGYLHNLIFLPGTATEKLRVELQKINFNFAGNQALDAFDMSDAVKLAIGTMSQQGVLLLSPGAASFGLFAHEFDRGEKFNLAVEKYFS